jgi:hypothetical protein
MDKIDLVEGIIDSGRSLIEELDRQKLSPKTAYWEHTDDNIWKLRIYSPYYFKMGARKIYERVRRIINDKVLGIELSDVSVVDSFDQTRKAINMMISTGETIGGVRMTNNRINGLLIRDVYLYRSNP